MRGIKRGRYQKDNFLSVPVCHQNLKSPHFILGQPTCVGRTTSENDVLILAPAAVFAVGSGDTHARHNGGRVQPVSLIGFAF